MGETQFKEKVEVWLTSNGHWFIKYWAGAKYTKEGLPDILACIDGMFYGLELKGDSGKPKLLQLIKLRDIRKANGKGVLLYPEDFNYFISLVKGEEIGKAWYKENIDLQKKWFEKLTL